MALITVEVNFDFYTYALGVLIQKSGYIAIQCSSTADIAKKVSRRYFFYAKYTPKIGIQQKYFRDSKIHPKKCINTGYSILIQKK